MQKANEKNIIVNVIYDNRHGNAPNFKKVWICDRIIIAINNSFVNKQSEHESMD